ncbi:MAG: divalent-cation tolerance protein CutA [Pseudomonadota bacterium]
MSETIVVLCTCPDAATGERLARGLVEAHHAACVNILPGVRSIYAWKGEVQDQEEVLLIIKTTRAHFFVIEHWLTEHHPYEVPELIALDAGHVSEPYLQWLRTSVSA